MAATVRDQLGQTWSRRIKRAQSRLRRYSRDWKALRKLYVDTQETRRKWGVDVPLGRTLVDGIVADSYVQNPDPLIESQNDSLTPDMEMRLRNLFRTLHEDTDTKTILQRGRIYGACCGYAVHWASHDQGGHHEPIVDNNDRPVLDEEGNPQTRPVLDWMRLRGELVSPWDFLVDPNCRDWRLRDAGWIARTYSCTLQTILDDDSGAFTAEGKARLKAHVAGQSTRRTRADGVADMEETDPRHRIIDMVEIWSRADGWKVYQMPFGAEIVVGEYDACDCWKNADTYPATMIAVPQSWNPADEDGDGDFYPTPDLRRVRSPLENLPRLEASFLDAVTNTARKWFGLAGMFDQKELDAVQADENRVFTPIQLKPLLKQLLGSESVNAETLMQFDVKRWLSAWPSPDAREAIQQLEAIQHQLDLCFMLLGRGPMDRGGIPKTESATSSLGIQERLSTWRDMAVEAMADIADQISEKDFIMLKEHGTVPMQYRIVADGVTTFDLFDTSELTDMSLVFRHHVGTSRPPTREARQAERERVFAAAAPVLSGMGDTGAVRELLAWVVELADSQRAQKIVDPRLQEMATDLLVTVDQFRQGQLELTPSNGNMLLEKIMTFLGQYLPPARIQQAAAQQVQNVGSEATPPAEKGVGSMPAAKTPGGAAFSRGLAGAGAVGGMGGVQ